MTVLKFWSSENTHKFGWGIIAFLACSLVIPSIISGFTTREKEIQQGVNAQKENLKYHPQIDSLKQVITLDQQGRREFLIRQEVRDSFIIEGFKEVKEDIKDIKHNRK